MGERNVVEEGARVVAEPLDRMGNLVLGFAVAPDDGQQRPLDIARELLEPVIADAVSEVLRRDVLELMCLVDNRAMAVGITSP